MDSREEKKIMSVGIWTLTNTYLFWESHTIQIKIKVLKYNEEKKVFAVFEKRRENKDTILV